jgi:regulatory protein YycH of two-component signal transduction system YycFG
MRALTKEKFKTILLTALILLSIALTQKLWFHSPLKAIAPFLKHTIYMNGSNQENIKDISSILFPQSFTINFGGGLHTVFNGDLFKLWEGVSQDLWKEVFSILQNNYFNKDVVKELVVEKIEREKWIEASNAKSIEMQFGFAVPINGIIHTMEEDEGWNKKIGAIDSILFSFIDDSCIYMANQFENTYYRIEGEKNIENHLGGIIDSIQEGRYNMYYAMKDIYGIQNNTLMPVALVGDMPKIQVAQEIDSMNEDKIEALASTFFGENFDFVRKITETSGTVIYMYGYGQKTLKIDALGILEYREQMYSNKLGNPVSFRDALQIAIQFISEHGGWPSKHFYLKDVKTIEKDKKKGYQFIFGYKINGLPVYYDNKVIEHPIEVQVLDKQVIYYKRFVKKEKTPFKFLEMIQNHSAILLPSDVLDKNFNLIKKNYIEHEINDKEIKDSKKIDNMVLEAIEDVESGYYNQTIKAPNVLIPVWIIKLDKDVYYFDAYTGKMVNQSKK